MTTLDNSQDQDTALFNTTPYEEPKPPGSGRLMKIMTVVGSVALIWIAFTSFQESRTLVSKELLGEMSIWFTLPFAALITVVALSYIYKTLLWAKYRPMEGATLKEEELPNITVVIPAYNEGPMVQKSILSAIESDYPADKLNVICVDDGSEDDTFLYMERARGQNPSRITTLTLGKNQGKRHALYAGMERATGEIIITLDSDSVLPKDSIRNLIAPFVLDGDTGAVAGSVRVYNRYRTVITRMLGVRYILGFDYIRAYQSELKTVFCCPGAFSAYRASVIRPHLDGWLNQTFLGNRCTNGDDHALTNVVLKEQKAVRYQSNAPVYTIVPGRYRALCRMYTRWARSNIRESWNYLKFSANRAVSRKEGLAFVDGIVHAIHIPIRLYLLPFSWYLLISDMGLVVKSMAVATVVSAIYALFFYRSEKSTESLYGVIYGWFAFIGLQWIYPLAAVTVSQNQWMTRNLSRVQRGQSTSGSIPTLTATSLSLVETTTLDTHH